MTDQEQDNAIVALQTQLAEIIEIINLMPNTYAGKLAIKSQLSILSGKITSLESEVTALKNRVTILEAS